MRFEDYAIRIEPLPSEEGGGFLVTVPDLPGCVADGDTIEQAIVEAQDAFAAWAVAERQDKGDLPTPSTRRSGGREPEPARGDVSGAGVGAEWLAASHIEGVDVASGEVTPSRRPSDQRAITPA